MILPHNLSTLFLILLSVSFLNAFAASPDSDLIKKANADFNQKKYEKVIEALGPKQAELTEFGFSLLGRSYSQVQKNTAAVKVFEVALSKFPKSVELKSLYGRELYFLKKEKDAVTALKEAIELDKKYEPTYQFLISIFEKSKNTYELRQIYQDMILHIGEKYEYVARLCELSQKQGLHDVSQKHCNRCIELNPRRPDCAVYLALTQKDASEVDKAIATLKKTASSFSKSELAQLTLAQVLYEQKSYIDSFKYFGRALQVNPKSFDALVGHGLAGVEIQNFDSAFKSFKRACVQNKNASASIRKALVSVRQFQNKEWESKFENLSMQCQ
jgi:tetratricopeptide (TPR) repeat protein